jgi:hypothetical protein
MGFRSTLVSQHYGRELPQWFHDKYQQDYFISGSLIASKRELKYYDDVFMTDYQRALNESGLLDGLNMEVIIIAEDGFVTKVIITKDVIRYLWFDEGQEADHIWCQG